MSCKRAEVVMIERVLTLLELGDALLDDNAEHVATCCQTSSLIRRSGSRKRCGPNGETRLGP